MGPMNNRPMPTAVEYDCNGQRKTKTFPDAYAARRFYATKLKDGKNPTVKKVN